MDSPSSAAEQSTTSTTLTVTSSGENSKRSSLSRNEQRKRMKNSVDDEMTPVDVSDAAKKLERINNISKAMESSNQILERQINAEFNRQKLEAANQKQKIWTEKLQGLKFMIADDV